MIFLFKINQNSEFIIIIFLPFQIKDKLLRKELKPLGIEPPKLEFELTEKDHFCESTNPQFVLSEIRVYYFDNKKTYNKHLSLFFILEKENI